MNHYFEGIQVGSVPKNFHDSYDDSSLQYIPMILGKSIHNFESRKMSDVYLLVYTFQLLKILTLQHTEIRVHGQDLAYGRHGISIVPNNVREDMQLIKVIYCGKTNVSDLDLTQFLIHIARFFTKKTYRLFTNNCRKFSSVILEFLETDEPDEGKRIRLTVDEYDL